LGIQVSTSVVEKTSGGSSEALVAGVGSSEETSSLIAQVVRVAGEESNEIVDATTDMLMEIKNMSDKEIGLVYRDVQVEEQVKQFCKKQLFHSLKFIVNKSDLSRLLNTHDIGNVVMKGLNVTDETVKARWWLLYQQVVKRSLDTQRSNCNMAVKSVVISTCL
jgi:hypothetical protein